MSGCQGLHKVADVSVCLSLCMIRQAESEKKEFLSSLCRKKNMPQLYFLHCFYNKTFKCISVCACAWVCIREIESGRRIPRTHELGLIFCLITQWQARGCPVSLHANGPRARARLARITCAESKGRSMTHHIRATEHMYPEDEMPHRFLLKNAIILYARGCFGQTRDILCWESLILESIEIFSAQSMQLIEWSKNATTKAYHEEIGECHLKGCARACIASGWSNGSNELGTAIC